MQQSGLEWFHRLSTEPRRLAGRYARNALGFPRLLWREWREHRRTRDLDGLSA
jgi:N-acetylglucosaminyldiphosphoundecaprenol N-acetyl-beta-D-mannosaminyltransferase